MRQINHVRRILVYFAFLAIMMPLTGCASGKISFLNPVDDSITPNDYDQISTALGIYIPPVSTQDNFNNWRNTREWRNNFVSMKMFEIDKKHTQYVHDIAHGDTFIGLFGDITQLGLTTAAAAIPVTQTTKVLAAAATAVGAAKAVYDKDVFLAQTLQIVETQMNTDRESVKQTIIARMACEPAQYPIGMVLSDLESYADAGTVTSALVNVSKSVTNAKPTTSASKGTAVPESSNVSTDGTSAPIKVPGGTVTYSFKATEPPCPVSKTKT